MELNRITEIPPITSGRNCNRALARSAGSRSTDGFCTQSTSPFIRALAAVEASGITCHSIRSKCASFGPAVKEAGREKEMWMLGGAGMKDVVKMVMDKDPMVPANITYPPSMIATGIHMAASAMRDGKTEKVKEFLPKHLMIDVELVTPENAKQYYFAESVY